MEWPESTDISCWYCVHPFEGSPISLPTKYDDKRRVFYVFGVFCTWGCAKKFNMERDSVTRTNCATLLSLLRHRLLAGSKSLDHRKYSIVTAPHRNRLRCFGGDLTIDQFRSGLQALERAQATGPVAFGNGELPETDCFGEFRTSAASLWGPDEVRTTRRCPVSAMLPCDDDAASDTSSRGQPRSVAVKKRGRQDNTSRVIDSINNAPSVKNQPYKLKRSKPVGDFTNTLFQSMKLKVERAD
jgi:MYM-type Zinc finger with FCS sequence motif